MTRTLPFVVQPKREVREVGDPDSIGTLVFPVLNGLKLSERLAVKAVDQSDAIFKAQAQIVLKVLGTDGAHDADAIQAAYAQVSRVMAGMRDVRTILAPEDAVVAIRYTDELQALQAQIDVNDAARSVAAVTALIRHRLDGCEDWSEDDTRELDERLIGAVYLFYLSELMAMNGAVADPDLVDALGKSPPEPGNPPPNPIGNGSTGDFEPPTQDPPSSDPTASPTAPSATSSPRGTQRSGRSASGSTMKNSP